MRELKGGYSRVDRLMEGVLWERLGPVFRSRPIYECITIHCG